MHNTLYPISMVGLITGLKAEVIETVRETLIGIQDERLTRRNFDWMTVILME